MNRKLVFWTAFNSYQSSKLMRDRPAGAIHPVRTPEWTRRRVDLFKRYNLPSILSQKHSDFLYVILLDPELKKLTDAYLPPDPDPRVIYCYEDAPVLERIREHDEIVLALIDNDDMYSRDAGALMFECPAEWMYFKKGFAIDDRNGRVFHYDTIGSGPFFARRIDPKRMMNFDRDKRHPTHKAVIEIKGLHELPAGNFCVVLHNRNTSSHVSMRYVKGPARKSREIIDRKFVFIRGGTP